MDFRKELIQPVNIGGAPIYVSDLLNDQINVGEKARSYAEYYKSKTGSGIQYDGFGGIVRSFKNGVFITEPTIDDTTPTATVVGACVVYLNGRFIEWPGGTFDLSSNKVLIISEGPETREARVFEDGNNKEVTVSFSASSIITPFVSPAGLIIPTSLDLNKEHLELNPQGLRNTISDALGIVDRDVKIARIEADVETNKNDIAKPIDFFLEETKAGPVTMVNLDNITTAQVDLPNDGITRDLKITAKSVLTLSNYTGDTKVSFQSTLRYCIGASCSGLDNVESGTTDAGAVGPSASLSLVAPNQAIIKGHTGNGGYVDLNVVLLSNQGLNHTLREISVIVQGNPVS